MKKILLLMLCCILMLSLFACDEKKSESPKAPDWQSLVTEYDTWANEYIAFQIAYQTNPGDASLSSQLEKWAAELGEWTEKTSDMLDALNDFPTDRSAFASEINRVLKKIADGIVLEPTEEEISVFVGDYHAWAANYVTFLEAMMGDGDIESTSVYQEFVKGMRDWKQKADKLAERIKDQSVLEKFNADIAYIGEIIARVYN